MRSKFRLLGLALVVIGSFAMGHPRATANASEWWCFDDPVVVIKGYQTVHVRVGVPDTLKDQVVMADIIITDAPVDDAPGSRAAGR